MRRLGAGERTQLVRGMRAIVRAAEAGAGAIDQAEKTETPDKNRKRTKRT